MEKWLLLGMGAVFVLGAAIAVRRSGESLLRRTLRPAAAFAWGGLLLAVFLVAAIGTQLFAGRASSEGQGAGMDRLCVLSICDFSQVLASVGVLFRYAVVFVVFAFGILFDWFVWSRYVERADRLEWWKFAAMVVLGTVVLGFLLPWAGEASASAWLPSGREAASTFITGFGTRTFLTEVGEIAKRTFGKTVAP